MHMFCFRGPSWIISFLKLRNWESLRELCRIRNVYRFGASFSPLSWMIFETWNLIFINFPVIQPCRAAFSRAEWRATQTRVKSLMIMITRLLSRTKNVPEGKEGWVDDSMRAKLRRLRRHGLFCDSTSRVRAHSPPRAVCGREDAKRIEQWESCRLKL